MRECVSLSQTGWHQGTQEAVARVDEGHKAGIESGGWGSDHKAPWLTPLYTLWGPLNSSGRQRSDEAYI